MPYIFMAALAVVAAQGPEQAPSSQVAPESAAAPAKPPSNGGLSTADMAVEAGALIAAGALGPAVSGGVLAVALVAAAYSTTVGLRVVPWLLASVGLFAMVAVPAGFVLAAAALARVRLRKALPAAVLAPGAGTLGALGGGGAGLLLGLVAVQAFYPEAELAGDLVSSALRLGALGVLGLSVATGAALGGALGGGAGAALGYGAGWGLNQVLEHERE